MKGVTVEYHFVSVAEVPADGFEGWLYHEEGNEKDR
jgi:hypothetical protein